MFGGQLVPYSAPGGRVESITTISSLPRPSTDDDATGAKRVTPLARGISSSPLIAAAIRCCSSNKGQNGTLRPAL